MLGKLHDPMGKVHEVYMIRSYIYILVSSSTATQFTILYFPNYVKFTSVLRMFFATGYV